MPSGVPKQVSSAYYLLSATSIAVYRFLWARIKCSSVVPNFVILHGATALSSSPDMRPNSCGRHPFSILPTDNVLTHSQHRNATAAPIKRTAVERQVNVQIVFLFFLLLALSVGSSIGSVIRMVGLFVPEEGRAFISTTFPFSGFSLTSSGISRRRIRQQTERKPSLKASYLLIYLTTTLTAE